MLDEADYDSYNEKDRAMTIETKYNLGDVGYMRHNVELNQIAAELIDALYDMVIKLKEEGVI